MKCPFRIIKEYDYVKDHAKDGDRILAKSETEHWPECYGNECPYYIYGTVRSGCELVEKYSE